MDYADSIAGMTVKHHKRNTLTLLGSLRFRLLGLTLLIILPLLLLILSTASEQRDRIATTVQNDALRLTKLIASNQQQSIDLSSQLLHTLSRLPDIQAHKLESCNGLLAELLAENPIYTNIYTVSSNGDSQCGAISAPVGAVNLNGVPWFHETETTGELVIARYEVGRLTGLPVLPLAKAVYNTDQQWNGIVGASLSLSWLNEFIADTPLPEGATLTVLDSEGVILGVYPNAPGFVGESAASSPIVQEMLQYGEGVTRGSGLLNIPRLFGYTSVGEGGAKLYIILSVPEEQVFAEVNEFQERSLISLTGVSALAMIVAWAGSNWLVLRPIDSLVAATKRLAHGDLTARAYAKHGVVEFDALSNSFNDMASRLEERNAQLAASKQELENSNRILAKEIEERRNTEDKLRVFTTQLESSNQDLEQFAYVASHDLQEPLRVVAGYLQLIERRYKGKLDQDADEFIAFAVDAAKRMQTLINDLLAYSRIGRRSKPLERIDCTKIAKEAIANLKVMVEEANATVLVDALPTVMADPSQLVLVFQNLISNGIKFHGDALPEIHISAKSDQGQWVFSVRDNGIGIDPQYNERIFLIFQRLHTREEYPGTGIGLAVCQKIIEYHGGKIWVESQPGAGTTFYFTLPQITKG